MAAEHVFYEADMIRQPRFTMGLIRDNVYVVSDNGQPVALIMIAFQSPLYEGGDALAPVDRENVHFLDGVDPDLDHIAHHTGRWQLYELPFTAESQPFPVAEPDAQLDEVFERYVETVVRAEREDSGIF